jgi:glycosyltransferase involved in cell wall biosynthesis
LVDTIITPSEHLKNFISKLGKNNKIIKINNGIEITEIRKESLNKSDINLVIVSRLVIQKNINIVIEALKILNNKNLKLNIIGQGGEYGKLKELIKKLDLQNEIKLLGKIENNKISEFLNTSDIFIQASNYEGLPHSILEAINYEVPILSTEVGGCKDLLNNGEQGFIISSPPDKNSIAENITYIINNKEAARKKATNAKAFIKKEYNFSKQADLYMKIFKESMNI